MVKSYLKYEFSKSFGVVASSSSNAVWTPEPTPSAALRNTGAGRAYVAANEQVLCWDVKKGELLSAWRDQDCAAEVTTITRSQADPDVFAVGYTDGSIRLWDSRIAAVILSFNGHKSAITALAFESSGARLASGSRDTNIIVWDLVAERGLFKLRGHKGQITGLHFVHTPSSSGADGDVGTISHPEGDSFLLSTSKDAMIKIWDIESQYCIETHVTQTNGECWAMAVSPDGHGCITAGNDGEMMVWDVDTPRLFASATKLQRDVDAHYLRERGIIRRQGSDRTIDIKFHPTADYFAVHGSEKAVELWRIRGAEEVRKALARRRRRKREKTAAREADGDDDMNEDMADPSDETPQVLDVIVPHVVVRTGGKVRSMDWAGGRSSKAIQLLASTTNNQIEVYSITPAAKSKKAKAEDTEYTRTNAVELPGHRTDIRSTSLSADDRMLATASNGTLKIWNIETQSCLRTLDCGYALCCAFLPGDKIVVVGNKSGDLELFDIASSTLIDTIKAHDGAVWTLKVHPDGRSVVTGSADHTAKFWSFEIIQEDIPGTRRSSSRLALKHTRTLKTSDDILSLCFSPDAGRLLAVAALDNTVKVFFTDTLKLFLTLVGHKLPVLSLTISSDAKLIATCSADKNVRIWGLDFGDCHKAFFGHDDSIMAVSFIPHPVSREDAHIIFSAAKDGHLRSWDADKFQALQTLRGHHSEIWALSISRDGAFVVTASHDKSVRIWRQSDEPLFLEEERERELEEAHDANVAETLEKDLADEEALHTSTVDQDGTVAPASKQNAGTLTAGEKITEALRIAASDLEDTRAHEAGGPPPTRHPLLAFRNVPGYYHLLQMLESIPGPSLQDALLLLSFSQLPQMFTMISLWLQRGMNVPLSCRVLFFLLQVHHKQIVASKELRVVLVEIQPVVRKVLVGWKDLMGFNLAGVGLLGRRAQEGVMRAFEDEEMPASSKQQGKKRGFVSMA